MRGHLNGYVPWRLSSCQQGPHCLLCHRHSQHCLVWLEAIKRGHCCLHCHCHCHCQRFLLWLEAVKRGHHCPLCNHHCQHYLLWLKAVKRGHCCPLRHCHCQRCLLWLEAVKRCRFLVNEFCCAFVTIPRPPSFLPARTSFTIGVNARAGLWWNKLLRGSVME